jgi:hypothetical protein
MLIFMLINDWTVTALCQHKKEVSEFFGGIDNPMSTEEVFTDA